MLVTQSARDVKKFARYVLKNKPDAVIVNGGDGTIVDVASVLYSSNIPIIIIPGGTANILAKELQIPTDITKALSILGRKPKLITMNVANVARKPLFLRIEVGILAKMVKQASRELKENVGILTYPLTALKEAVKAPVSRYTIAIDGKRHSIEGVGMMIANVGNVGIQGISLQSKVKCDDDLLDVMVLQSADITTLIGIASSALTGTKKPVTLKHWQGKHIKVQITPKQTLVSDDKILKATSLTVRLTSHYLHILV